METNDALVPKPSGEKVLSGAWKEIFDILLETNPNLSLYDGENEMNGIIDRVEKDDSGKPKFIHVDALLPDYTPELLEDKQILNLRMQYFHEGLHNEITIHGRMIDCDEDGIGKIEMFAPLKRTSNLYLAYPDDDEPVYVEIPITGAPPEIKVLGVSTKEVIAHADSIENLLQQPVQVNDMTLNLNEIGSAKISGKIKASGKDQLSIELEVLGDNDRMLIQKFQDERFNDMVQVQQSEERDRIKETMKEKGEEVPEDPPPAEAPKEEKPQEEEPEVAEIPESETPVEEDAQTTAPPPRSDEDERPPRKLKRVKKDFSLKDGPGIVLVVIRDSEVRKKWIKFLTKQGWKKRWFGGFDETLPSDFPGISLLWVDANQKSGHSIDFIKRSIQERLIEPMPFVLMGENIADADPSQWDKLGTGLFVRPNAPEEWLNVRMSEWLNYDFPSISEEEEPEPTPEEPESEPAPTGDSEDSSLLDSAEEKVFESEMPVEEIGKGEDELVFEEEPEEEKPSKLHTIFILSDTKDGTDGLKEILEKKGFKAVILRDMAHAKKYCEIWIPELIVLNVNLSIDAILPILREMHTDGNFAGIPKVLLAEPVDQSKMDLVLKMGVSTHISKPYDDDTMILRLDALLD